MTKMNAEDLLLDSRRALVVGRTSDHLFVVRFENCEIKDKDVLITTYGRGATFSAACEDYLYQIKGKTLVFNAYKSYRQEMNF